MRMLELANPNRTASGLPVGPLRLHPRLAIVEAGPTERGRVVDELGQVMAGMDTPSRGIVEVHGVLMDLSGATASMLAIDGVLQPVLRATDLPGLATTDVTRERRRLERHHDEARRRVAELRRSAAAAVAEREGIEERQATVDAELSRHREMLDEAHRRVDEVTDEHRATERRLAEIVERANTDGAEASSLAVVIEELDVQLSALAQQVADAEAARDDCRRALTEAEQRIAALGQHIDAQPVTGDPEAEVEAARAALSAAQLDLRAAEARLETVRTRSGLDAAAPTDRRARLVERRHDVDRELGSLDLTDPRRVELALTTVSQDAASAGAPDPVAVDLASRLDDVAERRRARQRELRSHLSSEIAEAEARLERARLELDEAQQHARGALLDLGARAAIERAHEDVLEAEDKASRRFSGASAKQRLSELRAVETELLGRFGLFSFSDYLLTASTARVDPAAELRYSLARGELDEAERHLSDLHHDTASDPEASRLATIEAGLRAEAVAHLGHEPDGDLQQALRMRHHAGHEVLGELIEALAAVGVRSTADDAPSVARVWAGQRHQSAQRWRELTDLITSIDAELAAPDPQEAHAAQITEEIAAAEAEVARRAAVRSQASAVLVAARARAEAFDREAEQLVDQHTTLAALLSEREAAERTLAEADEALQAQLRRRSDLAGEIDLRRARIGELRARTVDAKADHDRSVARRDELGRELERLRSVVSSASLATTPGSVELQEARRNEESAAQRLAEVEADADELWGRTEQARRDESAVVAGTTASFDDLEFYVLGRMASQRAVGFVGSVPLVIDDAFAGLPAEDIVRLLDRLDRMTESVQVIYLTDDPVVLRWVAGRPGERAALAQSLPLPAVVIDAHVG